MRLHYDVQLQPRGRLVRMEWDPELGRHIEQAISTDELTYNLYSSVCFAEGVTLRDLLMLIARDQELFTILTACDCIKEILDELEIELTPPINTMALELAWIAEIISVDAVTIIDSFIEFYGLGTEGHFALEFTKSGSLANLPLVLNEAFNVNNDEQNVVLSTTRRFTLLDIIISVIAELTALGSPAERDEALCDLRGRLEEDVNDENGHSMEEVRAEWERRSEEDRKRFPCNICGQDNRCMCFKKPDNICHDCFNKMREN